MKLETRKKISYYIDGAFVALTCGLIQWIFDIRNWILLFALFIPLIYIMFMLQPLFFRNASPGMKIMKIVIVDKDYKCPSVKLILKRWLLAPRWAFEWFKCLFNGNSTELWELKYLGTIIVRREEERKFD